MLNPSESSILCGKVVGAITLFLHLVSDDRAERKEPGGRVSLTRLSSVQFRTRSVIFARIKAPKAEVGRQFEVARRRGASTHEPASSAAGVRAAGC